MNILHCQLYNYNNRTQTKVKKICKLNCLQKVILSSFNFHGFSVQHQQLCSKANQASYEVTAAIPKRF